MRNIGGVVLGLVTAFALIAAIEWLGHVIYPPPPDLDFGDPDVMAGYIATLPLLALLFPMIAYFTGTFTGSLLACSIATFRPLIPAGIVGLFVIAGTIANLLLIPHPLWFAVVAIIGIFASAWLGMRLAPNQTPDP